MKRGIILNLFMILVFICVLLVLIKAFNPGSLVTGFVQYPYCGGAGSSCSTWNGDEPGCTTGGCTWQDSCYGSVSCSSFWDEPTCSIYGCSWNSECNSWEQICTEYEQICTEWDEFDECISWTDGDCISWTDGECISWTDGECNGWDEYCGGVGSSCSTWDGNDIDCTTAGCSWQDSCSGSVDCSLLGDASSCGTYGCEWNINAECGDTLLGDTTLADDMECEGVSATSYALALGAEGITLDCNGSSITGNGIGIGVKFSGVTGATIKNCEISGFSQGILSGNAMTSSNYILNNTVYNISQYGIAIRQANDYTIQDNEVSNSSIGIRVVASSGSIIYNNTIINPLDKGISLSNAENSNITGNTIQNADVNGIYLYTTGGGTNNLVQENTISLSETDVTPLSKFGMVIEDESNEIYDNIVDCTSLNPDYPHVGIWISGVGGAAENNVFSGNEIFNCDYGFDVWGADYFEISDEDYHDNTYGAHLQGAGTSSTLPLIENSRIYDNSHGVYAEMSSYVNIVNTNFTNNIGSEGRMTGLHVSSDSSAYVTNGNFESNGDYGIYDVSPESVYWTLTEDTYCTNNNIQIANGWMVPMGGRIIADNCTITINGEILNLSAGETGSYKEAFDESISTEFGNSSYGVTGEIHTDAGNYAGDLIVDFYEENPGGSGFYLTGLGVWVDASLSPEPADLSWWMLKIYYTDEDLAASGIDEDSLEIQFYNATDDTWYREANQGVNKDENYVWANLTHFSIFGIYGNAGTPSIGGGGGGATIIPANATNVTSNVSVEQPEAPEIPEQAPGAEEKQAEKPKLLLWLLASIIILALMIVIVTAYRHASRRQALRKEIAETREV